MKKFDTKIKRTFSAEIAKIIFDENYNSLIESSGPEEFRRRRQRTKKINAYSEVGY